jgi:hypothetical protein
MTVWFGRVFGCALLASALMLGATAPSIAREMTRGATLSADRGTVVTAGRHLDRILGPVREGAEVALAAQDGGLPPAADRGVETEVSLAVLIDSAEAEGDAEWECMTQALYFEARGEPLEGQIAVAEVILNRRDSGRYPSTVCGVVEQGTGEKWMCQFSYFCDGLSDEVTDERSWEQLGRVARVMLDGAPRELTDGAMFYHTKAVDPYWSDEFFETAEIGAHLFYTDEEMQMASSASSE